MAIKKIKVQECDAPDCDEQHEFEDDGTVFGITISGVQVHLGGGGGYARNVYACSEEHIAPAIAAAIFG